MTGAGAIGLRTFFRIADRWKLTGYEQCRILGLQSEPELACLKSGELEEQSAEMLERLSHLLGIYRAINTLLPVPEIADGWIRASNAARLFGGRTPAECMATGDMGDLLAVRQYLEAELL